MDYSGLSFIVLFAACDRRQCVNLTIVDDQVLEDTESFNVDLSRTTDLDARITLDPTAAVVDIIDNDSEHYEKQHFIGINLFLKRSFLIFQVVLCFVPYFSHHI